LHVALTFCNVNAHTRPCAGNNLRHFYENSNEHSVLRGTAFM